ncbi:protein piccolo-like [Acyrthosiphon pisum]|uniref:Uncharacterized protein n=1 Tax=Acyrthosiphon pisum TaxID=7029 RepID=A0A8R2NKL8_ACYPI|nr:protein piccolo-like [Acyrthosiphon pisum]
MSNHVCDAVRHKTKKFSFKRKPFGVNQTGQVGNVHEDHKQPEASQPKQAENQTPEPIKPTPEPRKPTTEPRKPTTETRKPTPETRKPIPETRKSATETGHYSECVNMCKSQNEQTEKITDNDVAMPDGFENKATQTRICCIHNRCKRKQRKRNGNFIQDTWFCLTKLCK